MTMRTDTESTAGSMAASSTAPAVRFERDGDLGTIVLANPPLNLLGGELQSGLHEAVDQVIASGVRAVLLRADGPNFSAGAQVQGFQSGPEARTAVQMGIFERLEALAIPTVAAVQGYALGGGFELALSCDLIWAADTARLGLVETTIGAFPFAGGVQRLVQRVGASRAKQIIFDGGRHTADQMLELGVVAHVSPADSLLADATAYAQRLASGPTLAFGAIKALATASVSGGIASADALMDDLRTRITATEDMQNGVKSLLANGPGHGEFHGR
jgi:enoyl-CoA hydratase/carnithine racemase